MAVSWEQRVEDRVRLSVSGTTLFTSIALNFEMQFSNKMCFTDRLSNIVPILCKFRCRLRKNFSTEIIMEKLEFEV